MLKIRRNTLKLRNPETLEFESINGFLNGVGGDSPSKYDADNNGIVDDSERLGGKLPSEYAPSSHTHTEYAPANHSHEETDPTILGWAKKDSEYEVTGNPVTLENFEHMPMNVVTTFEPKQVGSGDPYPAGGGKNQYNSAASTVLDVETSHITNDGIAYTGTSNFAGVYIQYLEPNTQYTVSASSDVSLRIGATVKGVAEYELGFAIIDSSRGGFTFTTPSDCTGLMLAFYYSAGGAFTVREIQIELGSEATEFSPFSNIRPITGWDGLKLNHTGKNLIPNWVTDWSINGVTLTRNADGSVRVQGTCTEQTLASICGDGTYDILGIDDCYITSGENFGIKVDKPDGTIVYYSNDTAYLNPGDKLTWAYIHCYAGETYDFTVYPQIEFGTKRTPYEPYRGTPYTVQLGETVYGGKFDWMTGKLIAEWAGMTFDSSKVFTAWGADYPHLFCIRLENAPNDWDVLCSHYKFHESYDKLGAYIIPQDKWFLINDVRFDNVDDFNAVIAAQYAAGTPVQIAYKLATPIEIQFDPNEIRAFEGINTLYGDGTLTVSGTKSLHRLISTLWSDGSWSVIHKNVITDTDPGAGVTVDYPDGTVIDVYE